MTARDEDAGRSSRCPECKAPLAVPVFVPIAIDTTTPIARAPMIKPSKIDLSTPSPSAPSGFVMFCLRSIAILSAIYLGLSPFATANAGD